MQNSDKKVDKMSERELRQHVLELRYERLVLLDELRCSVEGLRLAKARLRSYYLRWLCVAVCCVLIVGLAAVLLL